MIVQTELKRRRLIFTVYFLKIILCFTINTFDCFQKTSIIWCYQKLFCQLQSDCYYHISSLINTYYSINSRPLSFFQFNWSLFLITNFWTWPIEEKMLRRAHYLFCYQNSLKLIIVRLLMGWYGMSTTSCNQRFNLITTSSPQHISFRKFEKK